MMTWLCVWFSVTGLVMLVPLTAELLLALLVGVAYLMVAAGAAREHLLAARQEEALAAIIKVPAEERSR